MALTVSLDDIVASGNSLLAIQPHWTRVRLGDVGQVLNGYAFKAELFTREGGMPLIRIRDVGSAASETFYSGDFDERYVMSAGDLLVGMDGDFNCARWRGPRSLLNQRVCKITVDEALYLPRFLDYVLPGYLKAINDATSSITVKHLSSRTIQDIPLPLPPMDEQREIVAELEKQFSRLDEAVANLRRVKANLKRYKATVLQSAVDGVLIQSTSNFSEVPLQELIGRIAQGWSPKCDLTREALPDEWAIITTTAVQPMQYLDNQGKPLPEELVPRPGIEIKNGDFLMTRKGPRKRAGVACLVRSTRHRLMVCDTVYRFRCDESKVQPEYLEIALNAPKVVHAIDRHKAGISESGVSLTHDKLGSVLIPLPSCEAQAKIVAEVDRHLSIIREVESEVDANLQRAQSLRQATLAKAFAAT
jgi:type I restriction enzyme S subunit